MRRSWTWTWLWKYWGSSGLGGSPWRSRHRRTAPSLHCLPPVGWKGANSNHFPLPCEVKIKSAGLGKCRDTSWESSWTWFDFLSHLPLTGRGFLILFQECKHLCFVWSLLTTLVAVKATTRHWILLHDMWEVQVPTAQLSMSQTQSHCGSHALSCFDCFWLLVVRSLSITALSHHLSSDKAHLQPRLAASPLGVIAT